MEAYSYLLESAKAYERGYKYDGNTLTGSRQETLTEFEQPKRMEAIKKEHATGKAATTLAADRLSLKDVRKHREAQDEDPGDACMNCYV